MRKMVWWPAVLLIAACEHTFVVGEHGPGAGVEDAAAEGGGVVTHPDAGPPVVGGPVVDVTVEPSDKSDVTIDKIGPPAMDVSVERSDASDATITDDSPNDADAADRPVIPGCLPDGAGSLTFQSSGGLVLDIMRGNEITCTSNVMGAKVTVTDLAPRILSGIVALQIELTFTSLPAGTTGTTPIQVNITEFAGAVPPVWTSSTTSCSANIATNRLLEPVDGGALYEMSGTVTCTGALTPAANNSMGPLTISTYAFTTGVVYP